MPSGPCSVSTDERPALFPLSGAGIGLPKCCLTQLGHKGALLNATFMQMNLIKLRDNMGRAKVLGCPSTVRCTWNLEWSTRTH